MRFFLRWGCLLIFGLMAPIALPAGGGIRDKFNIVDGKISDLYLAGDACFLFPSLSLIYSSLAKIQLGTPLKVIRYWEEEGGNIWLQVKIIRQDLSYTRRSNPSRGWINV